MQGLLMQLWKIAAIAANPDKVWQTRRAMKPQPELDAGGLYWNFYSKDGGRIRVAFNTENPEGLVKYARYRIGEVVYIKEAWDYTCYGLDCVYKLGYEPDDIFKVEWHWKNPRTMPAWAARYFIKITRVEACRIRDIPPLDCIAEGIYLVERSVGFSFPSSDKIFPTGRDAYFALWEDINGKGSLSSNPWVWCYQFVKTARPEAER